MHSAYLSSNSRSWETKAEGIRSFFLSGRYLGSRDLYRKITIVVKRCAASHLSSELPLGVLCCTQVLSQLLILQGMLGTQQKIRYVLLLFAQRPCWWKMFSLCTRFNKDKWFPTSLTFFWRSTICERRCVISSCCREASSLFRASSSDRDVIWRLELPGMTERIRIWPKDLLFINGPGPIGVLPLLTQFFDAVVDKLLLLFFIRDCLCFQVTGLMEIR